MENKNVCTILNYAEHFLTLASAVIVCISISALASLLGIPVGIASSAIGFKIFARAAGFKIYKSIIKKKKKKRDSIELIAKSKLNIIEILLSKTLIDSNTTHS